MTETSYWVISGSGCPIVDASVIVKCSTDNKEVVAVVVSDGDYIRLLPQQDLPSTDCSQKELPIISTDVCSSWPGSNKYCLYVKDSTPIEYTSAYCESQLTPLTSDPSVAWVGGLLTMLVVWFAACGLLYKIRRMSQSDPKKSSFNKDDQLTATTTTPSPPPTAVEVKVHHQEVISPMSPKSIKNRQVSWSSAGQPAPAPAPDTRQPLGVLSTSSQNAPRQTSVLKKAPTHNTVRNLPKVEPASAIPYTQNWNPPPESETTVTLPSHITKGQNAAEIYIRSCGLGKVKNASVLDTKTAVTFSKYT
eukprot:TRINITY_DN15733_c0_g1_i1.p1 TRINITY_DN15733_c0_g1~~TRINITY_DN15733_c0_g1_i1.p1  ORF type:complete len:305 (+),score=50.34 TRINITY_DN15733_c0_g1_i1:351-1265(+)